MSKLKVSKATQKKLEAAAVKMLEKAVEQCVSDSGQSKLMIEHPEGGESVWITFATYQDRLNHDRGILPFRVIFLNNALVGIPTWGKIFKVTEFNRYSMPTMTAKEVIEQAKNNVICKLP